MSADTMVSGGGSVYYTTKIFRIRDAIVGVAGDVANTTKFLAWFRKECPSDEVGMSLDDDKTFEGLVLRPQGLFYYADCVEPDKLHDKFHAIGSGAAYGKSALALGQSTAGAVSHTCIMLPSHCGGKPQTLHLLPAERKARPRKVPPIIVPPPTDNKG